jgi:hypothetical protein
VPSWPTCCSLTSSGPGPSVLDGRVELTRDRTTRSLGHPA